MLIQTNFIAGKMNKSVDERLVPLGEYVDALNVRLGSTESTEVGAVENSKGNTVLTDIKYKNQSLNPASTKCIGAFQDGMKETIYWFVHDSNNASSASGTVSLIVSYNVNVGTLTYHVISETVLNFNPLYLITGVNKIGDLLFFTDNLNPPRYINVREKYNTDTTSSNPLEEDTISVIVKPPGYSLVNDNSSSAPLGAPFLELFDNSTSEDYMRTRFLCFAYRYRYSDGGYSAVSLFTNPAFEPKTFDFSAETFKNEGMQNKYNAARVYFSTGPSRVTEIQVLYKESSSNTIYIIDRLNKSTQGIPDNSFEHITFTNSKILSVLGSDELLRLYDNVPRLAQAQTIQGNRLIYGNYVDQYDVSDQPGGSPIEIRYQVEAKSTPTGGVGFPFAVGSTGVYNIDPLNTGKTIANSVATFDLTDTPLPILAGTFFQFTFAIQNVASDNNGGSDVISGLQDNVSVIMTFVANQAYPTVDSMLSSQEFQDSIGTAATIAPLLPYANPAPPSYPPVTPFPPNAGSTATDLFNSAIPYAWSSVSSTNPLLLINSSIDGACTGLPISPWPPLIDVCASAQEPMLLKHFGDAGVLTNTFSLQLPAVLYYFDNGNAADPNRYTEQFQYYSFNLPATTSGFTRVGFTGSLHSHRDYEVGVVYMDENARASTVLTNETNTVYFPASTSTQKNQAVVRLQNLPPYWASKYKFVMKPSQGAYETIWAALSFQQSGCPAPDECGSEPFSVDNSSYWFRLEGESQNIVQVGDILTVKVDANGPVGTFITAEVLDKEALYSGQIQGTNPPGLYIRLKPSGWVADASGTNNIDRTQTISGPGYSGGFTGVAATRAEISPNGVSPAVPTPIPAGSTIRIKVHGFRGGNSSPGGGLFNCNTCSVEYDSGIMSVANDAISMFEALMALDFQNMATTGSALVDQMSLQFLPTLVPFSSAGNSIGLLSNFNAAIWVEESATTGVQYVRFRHNIPFCSTSPWDQVGGEYPKGTLEVEVNLSGGVFCFESETQPVDPNLFYDASDLLDIDKEGFHMAKQVWNPITQLSTLAEGSVNQTSSSDLETTLDFYNCYMFGNGVESFRIEDRISGETFSLGQRVLAVSNQDFKEADRFSGMTYSGVYSDSANSNNLNEFNLGLVNFKDLETDFGPIMKMHSRETDILILQEDRISYVLSGKNVITDSTGGGAIASVPEVLGTQIARIEEFGISFNPESFVSWGASMFFTDTKRGAVLMLQGASRGNDQLTEVSSFGMRSWFRDQFNDQLTTQKLGGYDPYMDEYVLSTNRRAIPLPLERFPCGQELSQVNSSEENSFIIELGDLMGSVNVPYTISAGEITISIDWNGTVFTSGAVSTSGSFAFNKTASSPPFATVTITPVAATYGVTFECVEEVRIKVIQVVINASDYAGQSIHTEYAWDDGTTFSPTIQNAITLDATAPTSSYILQGGVRSIGGFPYDGASVTLRTRKVTPDDFNFDPAHHSFKILSSSVLYEDNVADIDALVVAASTVIPVNNPSTPVFTAEEVGTVQGGTFSIPQANEYLYLIWDLRRVTARQLCYSNTLPLETACCDCTFSCGSCWLSPVQESQTQACATNTDAFGASNQWSFSSLGSIPVVGDNVFLDSFGDCEPPNQAIYIPSGYYIADPNQPSSASPLNWIRVGANGLVIDSGTC